MTRPMIGAASLLANALFGGTRTKELPPPAASEQLPSSAHCMNGPHEFTVRDAFGRGRPTR